MVIFLIALVTLNYFQPEMVMHSWYSWFPIVGLVTFIGCRHLISNVKLNATVFKGIKISDGVPVKLRDTLDDNILISILIVLATTFVDCGVYVTVSMLAYMIINLIASVAVTAVVKLAE